MAAIPLNEVKMFLVSFPHYSEGYLVEIGSFALDLVLVSS